MCTLIAIHRGVPGRRLVVAANRDEYFDRPAEGPAIRQGLSGPILAPLDVLAGGTWLGLNGQGVFAALTNLRTSEPDPTRKSRGTVVMDALAANSAEAAAELLAALPRDTYNPFNCFVSDGDQAYVITCHDELDVHALSPGVHVIGNADASAALQSDSPVPVSVATSSVATSVATSGVGSARTEVADRPEDSRQRKVDRVRVHARAAASLPPGDVLDALAGVCREHGSGETPLDDTCVHMADTYGTRSSILLELSETPGQSRLLYAEGAPCRTPYQDFSSLLNELRQLPGYGSAEFVTRTTS